MGNSTQYVMTTCATSKHNAQALFVTVLFARSTNCLFQTIDRCTELCEPGNDFVFTIEMLGV